jgi:hypothetical protein
MIFNMLQNNICYDFLYNPNLINRPGFKFTNTNQYIKYYCGSCNLIPILFLIDLNLLA